MYVCKNKLAKAHDNIFKFLHEHDTHKNKSNRSILLCHNNLKESKKDSYLLLKKVDLDICKTLDKVYVQIN